MIYLELPRTEEYKYATDWWQVSLANQYRASRIWVHDTHGHVKYHKNRFGHSPDEPVDLKEFTLIVLKSTKISPNRLK